MAINPPIVNVLSKNSIDIATLIYERLDITIPSAVTLEVVDVTQLANSRNRVINEIASLIEEFSYSYEKFLEDPATVQDALQIALRQLYADSYTIFDNSLLIANKQVIDPVYISEALRTSILKTLSDNSPAVDHTALNTLKPLMDSMYIEDVVSVISNYNKHFKDFVAIDDFVGIDKYFSGTKHNIAQVQDVLQALFSKSIEDNASAIDAVGKVLGKPFTDNTALQDAVTILLSLIIADPVTTADTITTSITKNYSDYLENSTDLAYLALSKIQQDIVVMTESLLFLVTSTLNDLAIVIDNQQYQLTSNKSENLSANDILNIAISLAEVDYFFAVDYLTKHLVSSPGDSIAIQETLQRLVETCLADTASISEVLRKNVYTEYKDNTGTLDINAFVLNKNNYDITTVVEYLLFALNKALLDSVGPTDTNTIHTSSSKQDSTSILDSSRFTFTIRKNELLEPIDTCIVQVNKVYYDFIDIVENTAINSTKLFMDNASTSDFVSIVFVYGSSSLFNGGLFNQSTFG